MQEIFASGVPYDFINHMSGQCYPIKKASFIYDFLSRHIGKNFVSCHPQPSNWWAEAAYRYEKYHFPDSEIRGSNRFASVISLMLPKRKLPFDFTLYGSQFGAYWIITYDAARYIVSYLKENPEVEKFFRKTWGPDEFLFNTILMNSPHVANVINNNFRYIDWSQGGSRPKILTTKDFPALAASDCFIARKFDVEIDPVILDKIDSNLL